MNSEKYYKAINRIEDLHVNLACALNCLAAIREAIEHGTMEAAHWKDGLGFVCDSINEIQVQIHAVIDSCNEQPAASSGR